MLLIRHWLPLAALTTALNGQVLVNQSGYNTVGAKRFTAPLAVDGTAFSIVTEPGGSVAFSGTVAAGAGDFTAFEPTASGDFRVLLGNPPDQQESHVFGIGPFWMERVSYQRMIQFFIDSRSGFGDATSWDVSTGKFGTGLAWRDSHQFSFELRTLIQWYAANPDAFSTERMPVEGTYNGLRDTLPADTPEIVRLIHWGVDLYLRGNLNHTLIKEELAYFLYYYPLFAEWIPVSLYNDARDDLFPLWGNTARDRWNWYDISHTADLFQTYTVMGGTKGSFPPGHSIVPNLLMHAVALREGRADAADYLNAARNQTQWIINNLDPADPLVTKGQRMSEHILVPALAEFMMRDPAGPVSGVDAWLADWADTVISRSNNAWDFRKYSDTVWTPENPGSTGHPWWNEPGNVAGFPAAALAAASRLSDPVVIERLRTIAVSHHDQVFGRNPYNRHFSFRGAQAGYGFEGVETGWFSQHLGGLGELENSRGVLDSSPKHLAFPYNPQEPPGYVEGWVAFNSAWNAAMVWAARDRTAIRFLNQTDGAVGATGMVDVELVAPLNFNRNLRETAEIRLSAASGDAETLKLVETGPDSAVFRGVIYLKNTPSPNMHDGLLQAAAGSVVGVAYAHDIFARTATASAGDSSSAGLIIARSELPDADVGIAYGPVVLTALNATPPLLWQLAAGELPEGIQLLSDGTLSGVPTEAGAFPISIRLQDAVSDVVKSFTLSSNGLTAPLTGYRLAWRDEFNSATLDETKWQYRTDTRFWSKQLPQNVSVANGVVNLHLKKQSVDAVDYTAGGVISRELFRYGYYEAAMKVPPGGGWHTSFWMMKYNRPVTDTVAIELDVIENDSVTPLKYGVNVHRHLPLPHTTFGNKFINTPSLSAGFHVFGCEFTPERIRYFFDGALVQTVDATLLPHDDMNIWLTSIAAPLGGTTSVDDTQLPAVAQFDYVRFYEPFPAPSVEITSPASVAVTLSDPAMSMRLEASASQPSGTPVLQWSCAEGPGTVVFADPASAQTTATFSAPGHYVLLCSASNEGGSNSARINVGVAAPTTLVLREGTNQYQHAAAIIRKDHTDWNAGARDQLIVGSNTKPIRSVFSFDLSPLTPSAVIHAASLDFLTVGGLGSVGNLQLRELSGTPVEGTGISDGTTGSNLGIGTGTTWNTRNGGAGAADLWTTPGGDFAVDVLSEVPGFDATVAGLPVLLPSTPALVSAAQAAVAGSGPLDLILSATNESSSTSGFVRLSSDDDANEANRPALKIVFSGNELPTVDPGPAPAAKAGVSTALTGTAIAADQTLWQVVTGPSEAVITDPNDLSTGVLFPEPGSYQFRLSGTNTLGSAERSLTVQVAALDPAVFADWQEITWSGMTDQEIVAPGADPDRDGFVNLLEWALHLDAGAPSVFHPALVKSGGMLEFTYTRRKTAPGEAIFSVEWTHDMSESWSTVGVVSDEPVSVSPSTESVRTTIPDSGGKCFVRLKVSVP